MPKAVVAVYLLLAASYALAQSSQSCISQFAKADAQTLSNPQIADPSVLKDVLQYILLSSYTPDVKEKMVDCAYTRHRDAIQGILPPIAQSPVSAVPETFAPSVIAEPMSMVPATAPTVRPMHNHAPDQLLQNGQIMTQAGLQMMLMADMINSQTQGPPKPNKISAIRFHASESQQATTEKIFDEALQIISSERYVVEFADKSQGKIKAVKVARGSSEIYACVYMAVRPGSDVPLEAIFGRYPGFLGGGSPQKWAAAFEKGLLALHPNLTTETNSRRATP